MASPTVHTRLTRPRLIVLFEYTQMVGSFLFKNNYFYFFDRSYAGVYDLFHFG